MKKITEITEIMEIRAVTHINQSSKNFRINVSPVGKYWISTVTDAKGGLIKEFFGDTRAFVEWKADLFVEVTPEIWTSRL